MHFNWIAIDFLQVLWEKALHLSEGKTMLSRVVRMLGLSFTLTWESLLTLLKMGLFVTPERVFWSHCLLKIPFSGLGVLIWFAVSGACMKSTPPCHQSAWEQGLQRAFLHSHAILEWSWNFMLETTCSSQPPYGLSMLVGSLHWVVNQGCKCFWGFI